MKIKIIYITFLLATMLMACADNNKKSNAPTQKTYTSDTFHISFSYPNNWEVKANGNRLGLFEVGIDSSDILKANMLIWTEEMPLEISDSLYAKASIGEIKIKNPLMAVTSLPAKKLGENTFQSFEFEFGGTDNHQYYLTGYTLVKGKRGYNISCSSLKENKEKYKAVFESIIRTVKTL